MTTKTMKAVVRDRYGPPEVLHIEQVEQPAPKDDEVLVRIRATSVTRTDLHMCAAKPFIWRFMLGLLRPKARAPRPGVRRRGRGRRLRRHEVPGGGPGVRSPQRRARGVRLRGRGAPAWSYMPDHLTFEEAAGGVRRLLPGTGHLNSGGRRPGDAARRVRCLGILRDRGRAAREAPLRRPRDRGVQHEERRARAVAGSGRGRRLPQRGLHEAGRDVRRRPRRRGQALVLPLEARARAARAVRGDRPALQPSPRDS